MMWGPLELTAENLEFVGGSWQPVDCLWQLAVNQIIIRNINTRNFICNFITKRTSSRTRCLSRTKPSWNKKIHRQTNFTRSKNEIANFKQTPPHLRFYNETSNLDSIGLNTRGLQEKNGINTHKVTTYQLQTCLNTQGLKMKLVKL